MARRTASTLVALALLVLENDALSQSYMQPPPVFTQLGNFCPSGTCDIAAPVYVNVYWDSSVSQWNTDVAATSADMTVDRIDALANSLVHSQYFSFLAPYSVTSISMGATVIASSCGPPPTTINSIINHPNNEAANFANCVLANNPGINPSTTILNVLLPPQSGAGSPSTDFCKSVNGIHNIGDHDLYGSPVEMAIIPTNSACNGSLSGLFRAMTHEMVEAATDPNSKSPTGWKVPFGDEIGDICEGFPNSQAASPANPATQVSQQPFLFAVVSTYYSVARSWSDWFAFPSTQDLGNCMPLPPASVASFSTNGTTSSPFGAQIDWAAACGAGSQMGLAMQVENFGPTPWDLVANQSKATVFLNVGVDATKRGGGTWSAGQIHGAPPDGVTFNGIRWGSPNATGKTIVQVTGFGGTYGVGSGSSASVVRPGDAITINAFDTNFGQPLAAGPLVAEGPKGIAGLLVSEQTSGTVPVSSANWIYAGNSAQLTGRVVGDPNCGGGAMQSAPYGIEGVSVSLTPPASSDVVTPSSPVTTDGGGSFSFGWKPSLAGAREPLTALAGTGATALSQATLTDVHPTAVSMTPAVGPVAGGQTASLGGAGYGAAITPTVRAIGGANGPTTATGVGVTPSGGVQLLTPRSPLGTGTAGVGTADIVASVSGLDSNPVEYLYVVPKQPRMHLSLGGNCQANVLFVDVYDANGAEMQETVALRATSAVFQSGTTATVAAGTSIALKAGGKVTITATPQLNPELAVSDSFLDIEYCIQTGAIMIPSELPQFGPPGDPQNFTVQTGRDGIVLSRGGDPAASGGDFVKVQGRNAAALRNQYGATSLGLLSLRSLIRSNPSVFLLASSRAKVASFTSKNVRVTKVGSREDVGLGAEAAIDFGLPLTRSASVKYHVLHLISSKGVRVWQEVATTEGRPGSATSARITETGVYALVATDEAAISGGEATHVALAPPIGGDGGAIAGSSGQPPPVHARTCACNVKGDERVPDGMEWSALGFAAAVGLVRRRGRAPSRRRFRLATPTPSLAPESPTAKRRSSRRRRKPSTGSASARSPNSPRTTAPNPYRP